MKKLKCPNCGSENVELHTDLDQVHFYFDSNGNVDFDLTYIQDRLKDNLKFADVGCECNDCGEEWDYDNI